MFSCTTCFRRAFTSLLFDLSPARLASQRQGTHVHLSFLYPLRSRTHSTIQAIKKGHHRQVLKKALSRETTRIPNNRRRRNTPLPGEIRDVLARENNRKHLADEDDSASGSTLYQLQWLQDPLKLANAVTDRLRIGADHSALELVRGSEKTFYVDGEKKGGKVDNVVSWNHVMEYYMHKGDTREALKVYNEMKKRGHRPEAHTYTILLKGFSQNIKKPNSVAHAVSVYNSIFAPNSTVKPNTIHTNAVINVCARGGDMASLWAIAGRLPDRGLGAADHITYTSIINAIRADAEKRSQALQLDDEAVADRIIASAIQDGEKLWVDVNKRWRAGDLIIDEALTCAMGRLLLLSRNEAHHKSVFSLVEQTMRVPIYDNRQNSAPVTETSQVFEAEATISTDVDSTLSNKVTNFEPVQSIRNQPAKQVSTHAKPLNNTLSMLIQACLLTRNLPAGKYYWNLFTSNDSRIGVTYDFENFAQYLRLLRVSRSSKLARDLLSDAAHGKQPEHLLLRGNFIIAMSTCLRDKNNPNVFDYASDIFEMMQRHLRHADAKLMEMYLEIAISTTPGLDGKAGGFETRPSHNNAMRVLQQLEELVPEVKDMILSKNREEQYTELPNKRRKKLSDPRDKPDRVYQSKDILTSFMTALIGAYDRLLAQETLPPNSRDQYMLRKRRLHTFISKLNPLAAARRTTAVYSERDSGAAELESQEKRFNDRARGIKAPIKYHVFGDSPKRQENGHQERYSDQTGLSFGRPRISRNQGSYQPGMGSDFAPLARQQGHGIDEDFVSLGS